MESGNVIGAKEAIRAGCWCWKIRHCAVSRRLATLYAGFTADPASEVAPGVASAITSRRCVFIVEGKGAFTAVDVDARQYHTGDFILTPQWRWHDIMVIGVRAGEHVDGLDLPLVNLTGCGFAEDYPESAAGDAKGAIICRAMQRKYAAATPQRELVADFQLHRYDRSEALR